MSRDVTKGLQSGSSGSSGRSSPAPQASRIAVEEDLYKSDKGFRRYAAIVDRALATWDNSPEEWADYIAFLSRLLKGIQSHPKNTPLLPHADAVASKLAQCLTPGLPSGVHQKALEVYTYIFETFGNKFLAGHVSVFLPGLSSVLSFASLSVRPALYALFEEHIVRLPAPDLRAPLKSILLSLLPALEEETGEDFERACSIIESLERKFGGSAKGERKFAENQGFFWQCLFLCIISSPSRRQGALHYASRNLPRCVSDESGNLPGEVEALISPEAGLLIRAFVAGLSDPQTLIQRGFLDLLVSHIPLHSPVFSVKVRPTDLDRLVHATINVLLRRDMSLNRRLWSWFLGPDPKDAEGEAQSPVLDAKESRASHSQYQYFMTHGRTPLERTVLNMFRQRGLSSTETARPFRIALSLMDRWEIGGSLVPRVFLPAIEMAHAYSTTASETQTEEVVRSASLFFDGIEATLIWANLIRLLRSTLDGMDTRPDRLQFFLWIIENFNVKDEEMVTIHVPCAVLYLLSLLNAESASALPEEVSTTALKAASILLSLIPNRALKSASINGGAKGHTHPAKPLPSPQELRSAVIASYDGRSQTSDKPNSPFSPEITSDLLFTQLSTLISHSIQVSQFERFDRGVALLLSCVAINQDLPPGTMHDLYEAIDGTLASSRSGMVPYNVLNAIVTLSAGLKRASIWSTSQILQLEPPLSQRLWQNLSSEYPKYHVEATRSLWQLDEILAPSDAVKISLLALMTETDTTTITREVVQKEYAKRFTLLWNLTLPTQPTLVRRGSGLSGLTTGERSRQMETLVEPLLVVLDALDDRSDPRSEIVANWLRGLTSLPQILRILLTRLHSSMKTVSETSPDSALQGRQDAQRCRELSYSLTTLNNILSHADRWTWQCLAEEPSPSAQQDEQTNGLQFLVRTCITLLRRNDRTSKHVRIQSALVLNRTLSGTSTAELRSLGMETTILVLLIECTALGEDDLQSPLLQLASNALKIRKSRAEPHQQELDNALSEPQAVRRSSASSRPSSRNPTLDIPTAPPPELLTSLRKGFESPSSRPHLEHWLGFLSVVLPMFGITIFSNIIPLVETLCAAVHQAFTELVGLSKSGNARHKVAPDLVIMDLLEALEMTLAQGHDSLLDELPAEETPKQATSSSTFLGAVTSGVFKYDGPPSKTSQANSRLTIIIAFQDAVRTTLTIWTWASHGRDNESLDKSSLATSSHTALRVRNKTRQVLEHIFAVEPLESLEVVISRWRLAKSQTEASAALSLLQVMHGSRPKNVIPAILDSLCSRTNSSALSLQRVSSKTVDLSAADVAMFLSSYLRAIEDDAMDEIWGDCIAFMRDILSNPLPYRQVLAIMLSILLLLAQKANNTNFGDQKKMRRDLTDVFQRLLVATFTALPSGYIYEPSQKEGAGEGTVNQAPSLTSVLTDIVRNIETILESNDRITTAMNSISTNVIGPLLHAKSFPANVNADSLQLVLEVARKAPTAKSWKKELNDAFYDARLFKSSPTLMEQSWFPVVDQWALRDKEHMTELLSKLAAPSSAGIMFGVGASAARLAADRSTQLNLRRLCVLLLASGEDTHVAKIPDIHLKLIDLFEASQSSSPSSIIKAELFLVCRALLLTTTNVHLSSLWPTINQSLRLALTYLLPNHTEDGTFTNLGLLQACKLLDLLIVLSPDDFQLHEWLYISDTIDAVYRPADSQLPPALTDQVAEALGTTNSLDGGESSETSPADNLIPPTPTSAPTPGRRRPLLGSNLSIDHGDVKAMGKDDFARAVLRPFLSQVSMLAYEGVYSLDGVDSEACRRGVVRDVLEMGAGE